ncbi:MAG TPA: glucose 1-dehydrogenase [Ilumatobacteraceae bacterium]|nr:glucose 1-dehydrogenase [Ilumatobacteraceae bacterium]
MSNMFDLTGKVAVVTGSGRGLGRAIAVGLADAGASLVVCSRTVEEAESTAAEIRSGGHECLALKADTGHRESCKSLIDATVEHYGKIDVLVNNAGIDIIEPAEDVSEDAWDEVLNINLKGYFNCSQFAARQMLAQGTGGSIANNSSIASEVGIAGLTAYAAAKGGVNQMTKVMAVEWAPKGIRVNAFAPGYFQNVMKGATAEHQRPEKQQQVITFTPMGRRGLPEELVGPVVFLASDASSYVTGAVLFIDGGYTAQ